MDDFQKLLLETFAEEVKETTAALEKALLGLEQASSEVERLEEFAVLARRAHNIKGAAGAAGVLSVQSLAHAIEDGLTELKKTGQQPSPKAFDLLYESIDAITALTVSDSAGPMKELEERLRQIDTSAADASSAGAAPDVLTALPEVAAQAFAPRDEGLVSSAIVIPADPVAVEALAPQAMAPAPVAAAAPARRSPPPVAAPAPSAAWQEPSLGFAPDAAPPEALAEALAEAMPEAAPPSLAPPPLRPASSKPADAEAAGPRQTVRIAVDKLDALTNQISEIITIRKKSQARLVEVEELGEELVAVVRQFHALRAQVDRVLEQSYVEQGGAVLESVDYLRDALGRLDTRFGAFRRRTWHEATAETLLTERLPEDIKRLRMRPFTTIADHFRRTMRDAARHCDKQVEFVLRGMDVEADQVVLDVLKDPLMHLLRNSVDHGIEHEAERIAAGKPAEGQVTLEVQGRGATLYIRIMDNGRGIDPSALRERLRSRNLMPDSHIGGMSDREVIDLIFLPGFTTASSLGVISGRGIGMDVVRQAIQVHHGSVSVKTVVGEGTTFELTMPLSFATVQGIIVRVLGHDFALPMYALERLVRLSRKDIVYIEGAPTVKIEGEPVSLVQLSELIEVPPNFANREATTWEDELEGNTEAMLYSAIVRANDKRLAFLVDDFIGENEMVVKELPDCLGKVRNVAGATVTWSGEVMIILNPNDLVDTALEMRAGSGADEDWSAEALRTRRILVVDDSVTTRTLEKNILVAAGYDVVTAVNGIEALHIVAEQSFELIVLDVDMPELNGFDLTTRLRTMQEYRNVPIVLVTSRDSEEDKRRGLAAGADAYITKQSFTQRTFLESVRRFLN